MNWLLRAVMTVPALVLVGGCGAQPNAEIVKACADGRIDASRIVEVWEAKGVVRSIDRNQGGATIEVQALPWARMETSEQASLAIAVFCQVKDQRGRATVTVRSGVSGNLGAVVNGNWSR